MDYTQAMSQHGIRANGQSGEEVGFLFTALTTAAAVAFGASSIARKGDSKFAEFLKYKTPFGWRARAEEGAIKRAAGIQTQAVQTAYSEAVKDIDHIVTTRLSQYAVAKEELDAKDARDKAKKDLITSIAVGGAGLATWLLMS